MYKIDENICVSPKIAKKIKLLNLNYKSTYLK